jgi:hypothetical protein
MQIRCILQIPETPRSSTSSLLAHMIASAFDKHRPDHQHMQYGQTR